MKKYLIAIRTNNWDLQAFFIAAYYMSHGITVVAAVDERTKTINTGFIPKVSLNHQWLEENGMVYKMAGFGWRCGDYFYYPLLEAYPNFDGYWLVEDDAFLIYKNLRGTLNKCFSQNFDFLAAKIGQRPKHWIWHDTVMSLKPDITEVKGCSFGITFMSRNFCELLFEARKTLSQHFFDQQLDANQWPSDESFVMNFAPTNSVIEALETVFGNTAFSNYKFTAEKMVYEFDAALFDHSREGFFHPVIIKTNSYDFLHRKIRILERQHQSTVVQFKKEVFLENSSILRSLGVVGDVKDSLSQQEQPKMSQIIDEDTKIGDRKAEDENVEEKKHGLLDSMLRKIRPI